MKSFVDSYIGASIVVLMAIIRNKAVDDGFVFLNHSDYIRFINESDAMDALLKMVEIGEIELKIINQQKLVKILS